MTATATTDPMAGLAQLREREHEAQAHADQVDVEARASIARRQEAAEQLIEAERGGASAATRRKLELALAEAEEAASQPWAQRAEGARRASLDARRATAAHAAEHLPALVAELEEASCVAASAVDAAGERFVAATQGRAAAEQSLIGVLALAGMTKRDAVNRARSDDAALAVRRLLDQGGELAPVLRLPLPEQTAA